MELRAAAILAAGLALMASPGYAQNITYGGKVGVNFADVNQTQGPDSTDKKAGLVVGGFVEKPLSNTISFQPEVLYSQKGAKDHSENPEVSINVSVIQIPTLLKFNVAPKSPAHPFIVIGPGFAWVTSAKLKQDSNELDIKDDTEGFDPTFVIGFGGRYGNFMGEIRYDLGFRDLSKESDVTAKSRTLSLMGGYSFGKTK